MDLEVYCGAIERFCRLKIKKKLKKERKKEDRRGGNAWRAFESALSKRESKEEGEKRFFLGAFEMVQKKKKKEGKERNVEDERKKEKEKTKTKT